MFDKKLFHVAPSATFRGYMELNLCFQKLSSSSPIPVCSSGISCAHSVDALFHDRQVHARKECRSFEYFMGQNYFSIQPGQHLSRLFNLHFSVQKCRSFVIFLFLLGLSSVLVEALLPMNLCHQMALCTVLSSVSRIVFFRMSVSMCKLPCVRNCGSYTCFVVQGLS